MSGSRVDVDTSQLERGIARLAVGLDGAGRTVGTAQANTVASRMRAATPYRTGRLRSTISVTAEHDGAAVHYGGTLGYANYIDRRTGASESATAGADSQFATAMRAAARTVIGTL